MYLGAGYCSGETRRLIQINESEELICINLGVHRRRHIRPVPTTAPGARVEKKSRRITIIQGRPDGRAERFGRALEQAYADAARSSGHEVRQVDVARLDFPLLRTQEEWIAPAPADVTAAQGDIAWAEH